MQLYCRQKSVTVEWPGEDKLIAEAVLNDPVHEIRVIIEYSIPEEKIAQARAEFIRYPWDLCEEAQKVISRLEGLKVGTGMRRQVRQMVGGEEGCYHLLDLVMEAAAALVQAGYRIRHRHLSPEERRDKVHRELKGTCVAHRVGGKRAEPVGKWIYARG